MPRKTLLCLTLAAALVALPILAADRSVPRAEQEQLEALVVDLEELIGRLDGDPQPILRKLGNGLSSVTIPLSASDLERLGGSRFRTRNFKAMVNGHSKATPKAATKGITHPVSKLNIRYWFWMCAVNLNNATLNKNTIFKLIGPGNTFNFNQVLGYPANAAQCFVHREDALGQAGIYTHTVKVATGGKAKEIFIAQ